MRRAVLVSSILMAAGVLALPAAHAASTDPVPYGTFTSPSSAAGGSPMWVSSVTPCPGTPADHIQYVAVWISDQERPGHPETLKIVNGDVESDGRWRVSISAPSSTPSGATASYYVGARCIVGDPYPDPNTPDAPVDVPSQRYYVRALRVTSSGTGSFTGSAPSEVPGSPTTTTTTSTTSTSTTSSTSTTTSSTSSTTIAGIGSEPLTAASLGVAGPHRVSLDGGSSDVSLDAVAASGSRAPDSGDGTAPGSLILFGALVLGLGAGGRRLTRFARR